MDQKLSGFSPISSFREYLNFSLLHSKLNPATAQTIARSGNKRYFPVIKFMNGYGRDNGTSRIELALAYRKLGMAVVGKRKRHHLRPVKPRHDHPVCCARRRVAFLSYAKAQATTDANRSESQRVYFEAQPATDA
ncbi:MAG: hypothetical protein HGB06_11580 [Chlorobaculum sp.]|jgi:hypothetical protein|nr:hypothetical protein [Chlorobaculum sp.]